MAESEMLPRSDHVNFVEEIIAEGVHLVGEWKFAGAAGNDDVFFVERRRRHGGE